MILCLCRRDLLLTIVILENLMCSYNGSSGMSSCAELGQIGKGDD